MEQEEVIKRINDSLQKMKEEINALDLPEEDISIQIEFEQYAPQIIQIRPPIKQFFARVLK